MENWAQEGCVELGSGRVCRTGYRKGVENWAPEGCGELGSGRVWRSGFRTPKDRNYKAG